MTNASDEQRPLSDLAFDWVTVVKHKADALLAYDRYIADAEAAGSRSCAELLRKIQRDDAGHLEEARQHLAEVLAGRMGQGPR